jgi:hypothetical protein
MNDEILSQLTEAIQKQTEVLSGFAGKDDKTKQAHTGTYTQLHGIGGIFSGQGVERDVISAHLRPQGISSVLPFIGSVSEDPRFATLTGFTDVSGDEAVLVCDDAPAGYMKGCNLSSRFGRVRLDTQTIDMLDIVRKINRGDFTDLMLRGRVLGGTNLAPGIPGNEADIVNLVTLSEMTNTAVQTERRLSRQLFQGVITVANEFNGLDTLIATGIVDADTGVACPALDSDVKNFNYDLVGGTGRDIVEYLSMLEFYLRYNAGNMGLLPAEWVVVMRPELWFELSAYWPCSYLTHRCNVGGLDNNSAVIVDGNDNVVMRDAMRNGMYIDINGNRYNVVVDTGIFEHTNINNANVPAGSYASSIYMVPLSIVGGMPSCYREYVDFKAAYGEINNIFGRNDVSADFWTDNGVYSWAVTKEKWCIKMHLRTEQRVILRTPQLAGRIDAVRYAPLQHLRTPEPTSPYNKDGGVSVRGHRVTYLPPGSIQR